MCTNGLAPLMAAIKSCPEERASRAVLSGRWSSRELWRREGIGQCYVACPNVAHVVERKKKGERKRRSGKREGSDWREEEERREEEEELMPI